MTMAATYMLEKQPEWFDINLNMSGENPVNNCDYNG